MRIQGDVPRRIVTAVAVVAAAFAGVPPAAAKGPDTAKICGASACATVAGPEKVNDLALFTTGFATRAAPRPAPFYTVELTSSRQPTINWSFLYVPSARAIKIIRADFTGTYRQETGPHWIAPSPRALNAYFEATKALEPNPADAKWVARESGREKVLSMGRMALGLLAVALAGALLLALLRPRLVRRAVAIARGAARPTMREARGRFRG